MLKMPRFAAGYVFSLIKIKEARAYSAESSGSTKTVFFLGSFHLLGSSLREKTHAET
jgi:hypothetical protein